jgi:hypothetical protein
MEFEFDFGAKTLTHGVKRNVKKYASVAGVAFALSTEELVFMNKETGENHVMTDKVLFALSLCQQFKPLDQHIITIGQNIPDLQNQVQAIQTVVDFLVKNKLLLEDQEWLAQLSQSSQQIKVSNAGLVIRAFENPNLLNRSLESLQKYQLKYKQKFSVQVYCDSTSEKIELEMEEVCKSFKPDISITFFGHVWQDQFVKMLTSEFPKRTEEIKWLLSQSSEEYSGGRIWNLALLNNAGKKFLFFDDNYIFEARIKSNKNKIVNLNNNSDLSVDFSLNLTDIKQNSNEYEEDVLTQLINSCGQTTGNWLSTMDIDYSAVDNLTLLELQRIQSSSLIKSVGNGTWGSPRSEHNYWLYYLDGDQKQAFWETREVYLDNIEASNLMHYSNEYEFLSMARFLPSAIDNSTLTPFAMPSDSLEDYFFNAVSLYCYPNQISMQCPFMLGHIQSERKDRSAMNHLARTPNFNKFIADYALTLVSSTDAQDPAIRMKTLSDYILGLSDSSDVNIHNRLKEYLSQIRSDMVLSMQTQMANSPDAPVYWQADVREIVEANGKALIQNKPPILDGWDKSMDRQDCVETARHELNRVAQAMSLWPQLWEFCKISQ